MSNMVEFFQKLESEINDKSDYKVKHQSQKSYLGGGKLLNEPIALVCVYYIKNNKLSIQLESKNEEGSRIIKKLYLFKKNELKNLGYTIELKKGSNNKKWTRLQILIDIEKEDNLLEYVDKCVGLFIKYKSIVEDYIMNQKETWIFQGNPIYEQEFDFSKDLIKGEVISWSVKKKYHADKIKINDDVYIWKSDGNKKGSGGIVAYGVIVSKPYEDNSNYSVDIKIEEVRLTDVDYMMKRVDIKDDVVLSDLLIIKQPNGTNYKLQDYEASYIKEIWQGYRNYRNIEDVGYWDIRLGKNSEYWEECRYDSEILIGWEYLNDLRKYENKESINNAIKSYVKIEDNPINDTLAIYQFLYDIQIGDIVIAKQGKNNILGYGIVTSNYIYYEDKKVCKHSRNIKWIKVGNWNLKSTNFEENTLTDITNNKDFILDIFDTISEIKDNETVKVEITEEVESIEEYMKLDILKEVFIPQDKIDNILFNLDYKKNIILQGPPGVGKTFVAKRLCYLHQGKKTVHNIESVQFHQSYSYEDFIRGYRPNKDGGFSLKDGVFYKFTQRAINDPNNNYYFIIDEINRGNLSKIFGELMMLIENDKRGQDYQVSLTYQDQDEKFYIPQNLYIIGTMNTADRSLAMVDYALRRRFAFIDIEPAFDSEVLANHFKNYLGNEITNKIITKITKLNRVIEKESIDLGKGYRIGHSYFTPTREIANVNMWYENVIKMEIEPLIREYWFDESEEELQKKVADLLED